MQREREGETRRRLGLLLVWMMKIQIQNIWNEALKARGGRDIPRQQVYQHRKPEWKERARKGGSLEAHVLGGVKRKLEKCIGFQKVYSYPIGR